MTSCLFVRINTWKVLETELVCWCCCAQQSVSVMSWKRQACVAKVLNISQANLFLLSVDKFRKSAGPTFLQILHQYETKPADWVFVLVAKLGACGKTSSLCPPRPCVTHHKYQTQLALSMLNNHKSFASRHGDLTVSSTRLQTRVAKSELMNNVSAPWGAQIWSWKVLLLYKY